MSRPSNDPGAPFCAAISGRLFVFLDAATEPSPEVLSMAWEGREVELGAGIAKPLGINLVANGDFSEGLAGWSLDGRRAGVDVGLDLSPEWRLAAGHTLFVRDEGGEPEPVTLVCSGGPDRGRIPVVSGQVYRLSALLGTHRCDALARVAFLDATGQVLSTIEEHVPAGRRGGQDAADYHPVNQTTRVPAEAVQAELTFEKGATVAGQRDSFLFVADVRLGRDGRHFADLSRDPRRLQAVSRWKEPVYRSAPLPAEVLDGRRHELRVALGAGRAKLAGSPLHVHAPGRYEGAIVSVADGLVSGWLRDLDGFTAAPTVAIEVDGEEAAIGVADEDHESGRGFGVSLPGAFLDDAAHRLTLRAVPDGSVVGGSSHVLSRDRSGHVIVRGARGGSSETLAQLADALARSEAARRDLEARLAAAQPGTDERVHAEPEASTAHESREAGSPGSGRGGRPRPRAAVIAWDVGHNALGRIHVFHELLRDSWDVSVIGPSWQRYGDGLWPPLRSAGMDVSWWRCQDGADLVPRMLVEASRRTYDLVVVSKPRLPSMLLGYLIKEHSDCPLILDIDDDELAFLGGGEPIDLAALEEAAAEVGSEPYGQAATRYAAGLIRHADAVCVSNVALRRRYGGHLVRHARDEDVFRFDENARVESRRALGIADDEFALVFVGTAREHKGILVVAEALDEMDDEGFSLHVVGPLKDPTLGDRLAELRRARIRIHDPSGFADVPALLAAADAVPVLQEPEHPISAFQFPAKLSDALALGRPVLVTRVPPFDDVRNVDGIHEVDAASLGPTLQRLRQGAESGTALRIREYFLSEFSLRVNRARLRLAVEAAESARRPLPDDLKPLTELLVREAGRLIRERQSMAEQEPRVSPAPSPRSKRRLPDLALFWKQNDTGIYGRRPEMLVKHLLRSGKVGRVLYVDPPLSADDLERFRRASSSDLAEQEGPMLRNVVARWLGLLDDGPLWQRIYLHAGSREVRLLDRELPPPGGHAGFVVRQLEEAGFDAASTVAIVCPVVWDFPDIHSRFRFGRVIVDLIDDQRALPSDPQHRARLEASYLETMGLADVLISNCRPNAEAFAYPGKPVHVIPNGTEPLEATGLRMPRSLHGRPHPIVGYVGNMRDRIDWTLLETLVGRHPEWTFVLAGPTDGREEARAFADRDNVVMPGVVEYRDLPAYLHRFDAAMVPHARSLVSDRMNPLKVYNYLSVGLPVVATEVSNVDDVAELIDVAETADDFEAALLRALETTGAEDRRARSARALAQASWSARVEALLDLIEPETSPEAPPDLIEAEAPPGA